MLARRLRDDNLLQFGRELLAGVRRNRPQIDAHLNGAADNWSVERMAATDRNALRIGVYEILHSDTPDEVAVDEAIELAKRYGTAQSAAFVNGILDRLMPGKEKDDQQAPPAEEAPRQSVEKPPPESLSQRARRLKEKK